MRAEPGWSGPGVDALSCHSFARHLQNVQVFEAEMTVRGSFAAKHTGVLSILPLLSIEWVETTVGFQAVGKVQRASHHFNFDVEGLNFKKKNRLETI